MKNIIRALRLPFITASVFPFIFGSLIQKSGFDFTAFMVGLIAVICTHLGANLINDYADSKSGVDWLDKKFYKFFGGSKLIQAGVFSESFYLRGALICLIVSLAAVGFLVLILNNPATLVYYIIILILGFSYSCKPLNFSYRFWGEAIIFLLFGPAIVMGAYFIQTNIFPALKSFMLSLPFGFFTTAILFSNEVPDYPEDALGGKFTWVSLVGQGRAFITYFLIALLGFLSIALNIAFGFLGAFSLVSLVFLILSLKAANLLKERYNNKVKLMESSKLTIAVQALVSIILIIDILLH